jgi:hypothetical protein
MSDPRANERLTALAAVPLVLLLAVEGVTLLFLRPLLSVHEFVGLLLVPPVALKLVSTARRFLGYYLGEHAFVLRGPPALPLRALAPVLVLSTLLVLGTGIALLAVGPPYHGVVLLLHKASFVVWGPLFGIHVIAYVWRVPRLVAASAVAQRVVVGAAVVVGIAGAVAGSLATDLF